MRKERQEPLIPSVRKRLWVSSPLGSSSRGHFVPRVDVEETEDRYILHIDLPGVSREEVSIEMKGSALEIRGERRRIDGFTDKQLHRTEREMGVFTRTFALPSEFPLDAVHAAMVDGVLTISIDKTDGPSLTAVPVDG